MEGRKRSGSLPKPVVLTIISLFALSILVTAAGSSMAVYGQGVQNSPWPEFQQNSFHTGGSPLVGPSTNTTKWSVSLGGFVEGTPALSSDGSTLYFGTTTGELYAASASTGTIEWGVPAGGYSLDASPVIGPNGTIYFSSEGTALLAIDPNGSIAWHFSVGSRISSSPAVGPNGTIYFGTDSGTLYALSPMGTLMWKFQASSPIFSTPVLSSSGSSIVFGDSAGALYSLSSLGTVQWNYLNDEGPVMESAAFSPSGSSVYFDIINYTSTVNYLYSLSSSTGSPQWNFQSNASSEYTPAVDASGDIFIGHLTSVSSNGTQNWSIDDDSLGLRSSPVIGPTGLLYFDDYDNNLYAMTTAGVQTWNFSGFGDSFSTPLVTSNGTVYIGDDDGNLYSLSPTVPTATVNWSLYTGDPLASSVAIGSDGTIYAEGYSNTVYAFNPNGFGQLWNFSTYDKDVNTPAIASNGWIYVGSYDATLYVLYPNGTETPTSEYPANDSITSSIAIGPDGTQYFGDYTGYVYAVDSSGNLKWDYLTSDSVYSTPALSPSGQTLYVGSYDNTLHALSASSGASEWTFTANDWFVGSPVVGPGGVIYAGSYDGAMYALYPNGTQDWTFGSDGPIVSTPALSPNGQVLYFGSNGGKFYALNSTTGKEIWTFTTPNGFVDSPAAVGSDGTIYVGSTNGIVYALNPSGGVVWTFQTNGYIDRAMWEYAFNIGSYERISSPTPVIATGNTLYITTSDGYLYALGPNTTSTSTTTITQSGSTITNPYFCCTSVSTTTYSTTTAASGFLGLSLFDLLVIVGTVVIIVLAVAVSVLRSRPKK
jgi:outer membrane protein assembly factor BamB